MLTQPAQRYHSLDALRAAMMLLGIVLHSAASYTQRPLGALWPYHDPANSVIFDLVLFFIHLFRMPAFFVVAGFFAALLYYRDGPAAFARNRVRRVLLPMAIFWAVMMPLAGLGFMFSARQVGQPMPGDYIRQMPFLEKPLLGHLWFLYYLLFFYAASAGIVSFVARLPVALRERSSAMFRRMLTASWGVAVLGIVTTLTLIPMQLAGLETAASILPPVRILVAYGVFFAVGWLVFHHRELIPAFGNRWKAWLAGGVAAAAGYLFVTVAQTGFTDPRVWHLTAVTLAGFSIWLLIFGMIGLFVRHMETPRPLVRYFSDASYWIYLTHIAPCAWLPGVFAYAPFPAAVKFALVVGLTTLLTTVTYHYFVRSTAIGALLNGRRQARRLPSMAQATVVIAILCLFACTPTGTPARGPSPLSPTGSGGINRTEHLDKPYVLLISLDGFRADYMDKHAVPTLRRIAKRGVRATSMMPVFPSLTFPNHYSLVTGLRPDRHGLVANTFYDPARRQTYSLGNRDAVGDGSWYRGEPIWVTAETQGMVSACFFWPGSEAPIDGVRPTTWRTYDAKVTRAERIKTVIDWLNQSPERRPHLVTLYFSEIDSASHEVSIDSPRVAATITEVDTAVGELLGAIDALPIRDRVYVLVTSDHGMVDTTEKHAISLNSLIDMKDVEIAYGGPVASLHLRDARANATRVRDRINARLQHGRAYLRKDVPARHHYRADPRIGDVVVIMEESWRLVIPPPATAKPAAPRTPRTVWGNHGWDPALPSMQAVFLAYGPQIRQGATIPTVRNIDVYPLMTELLGLRPAGGIDGRPGLWDAMRTRSKGYE